MGLDGNYRIGISYPIINVETGRYIGVVGAVILTGAFLHIMEIFMILIPDFWLFLIEME
jgi:hypothetical protein